MLTVPPQCPQSVRRVGAEQDGRGGRWGIVGGVGGMGGGVWWGGGGGWSCDSGAGQTDKRQATVMSVQKQQEM